MSEYIVDDYMNIMSEYIVNDYVIGVCDGAYGVLTLVQVTANIS